MDRSDFEIEKGIREAVRKEGKWVDVIWMGILKRGYEAFTNAPDRLKDADR